MGALEVLQERHGTVAFRAECVWDTMVDQETLEAMVEQGVREAMAELPLRPQPYYPPPK